MRAGSLGLGSIVYCGCLKTGCGHHARHGSIACCVDGKQTDMSQSSISTIATIPCGRDETLWEQAGSSARSGAGFAGPAADWDEQQRLLQFHSELAVVSRAGSGPSAGEALGRCLLKHLQPTCWVEARAVAAPAAARSPEAPTTIEIDDCLAKLRPMATDSTEMTPGLHAAVEQLATTSLAAGSAVCSVIPEPSLVPSRAAEVVLCAVPLLTPGQTTPIGATAVAVSGISRTLALAMLSTYAQSLQQASSMRLLTQQARVGQVRQTLARGNADVEQASNLAQAATALLTRWAEQLRLSHLVWVAVSGSRRPQVVAISGATDVDPVSRLASDLIDATQMLVASDAAIGCWSTPSVAAPKFRQREGKAAASVAADSAVVHCLQSVSSELLAPAVLAWPCRGTEGVMAYLFLVGPTDIVSPEWADAQAAELGELQSQVILAGRVHQSTWQRFMTRPIQWLRRWRWILSGIILFSFALAAWPMPYLMDCNCELATTDRRYAVAPYAGTLKQVLVKPGEVVAAGTLLATMDDRELNIELAGKQAAYERERNQIASWRANGDLAKARIAELESERIAQEIALLNHHVTHREIRAPIAGTIVQGDLVELMGAPVEIGNNLFEVAGLADLLVQVEIPEYQYRFARPGQVVRLYLEAFPYEVFEGKIERLHPRATTREERNVFVAELRLPNVDNKMRPGMKGRAQVTGDAFPLAWKWLHYPYEKARSFVGWF